MLRDVDIDEISDGKRYHASDLVRISCNDCDGCSSCCHDMGDSIILDPYDIYMLQSALGKSFNELLQQEIGLRVVDGLITPHIRMQDNSSACAFLNEAGRCSVHDNRPGYCRLFPLGRIYENDSFSYFYQVNECSYPNKSKIKVKKWLQIPNLASYEQYILHYHKLTSKMINAYLTDAGDNACKAANMLWLNTMFVPAYDTTRPFYEQYYLRVDSLRL